MNKVPITHLEKQKLLTDFYGETYATQHASSSSSMDWCKDCGRWINSGYVLLCKKRKENKTSAEDGVVTGMLQELDGEIHEDVALLFKDPLLNFADSSWNAWEHHMVSLIPKPNKNATVVKHSHPNAVLPVIHTCYSRRLGLFCVDELAAVSAYQFAFAPGRQAEVVLFTIRQLLEKNLRFFQALHVDVYRSHEHNTARASINNHQKKAWRCFHKHKQHSVQQTHQCEKVAAARGTCRGRGNKTSRNCRLARTQCTV